MTSTSATNDIPLLTSGNYLEWSFRMRAYLAEKKLLRFISLTAPPEATDADNDASALGSINRRLHSSQFHHVDGLAHAFQVWEKLKTVHAKSGVQMQVAVLIRLFNSPYTEGTKVEQHIASMRKDFAALKAAGLTLEDKMQGALLLASLANSSSWDITINTITAATTAAATAEDVTFETVAQQLLLEDQRRTSAALRLGAAETAAALAAGRSPPGSAKQPNKKGRPNCTVPGCKAPTTHPTNRCYVTNGYPPNHAYHDPADWAKKAAIRDKNLSTAAVAADNKEDDGDWGSTFLATDDLSDAHLSTSTEDAALSATASSDPDTLVFKVDSGASKHYVCRRDWFTTYTQHPSKVVVATGEHIPVAGHGTIKCFFPGKMGKLMPVTLRNVQYVPSFTFNLLSVTAMGRSGLTSTMGKDCTIRNGGHQILGIAPEDRGLYRLTARRPSAKDLAGLALSATTPTTTTTTTTDVELWHQRLGHAHYKAVAKLFSSNMVADTNAPAIAQALNKQQRTAVCGPCTEGKLASTPVPTSTDTRATRPLERIHMDIWGPAPTEGKGGHLYYLLIVDDYSRWMTLLLMRHKSETLSHFKTYVARVQNLHSSAGHVITYVRTDNGGEFTSNDMLAFMKEKGMTPELTATYTPQQNGVAERGNRTILDLIRTLKQDAGVPESFWSEAAKTAVYARNRLPTRSLSGNCTPFEAWRGRKPKVGHMRRFGCLAYARLPKRSRSKLDARAIPCTFLGYSETSNTYRLWDNAGHRMIESRNVAWSERVSGYGFIPTAGEGGAQVDTSPPTSEADNDNDNDNDTTDDDGDSSTEDKDDTASTLSENKDDETGNSPLTPAVNDNNQPKAKKPRKPRAAKTKEQALAHQLGNFLQPMAGDAAPSPLSARPEAEVNQDSANFALLADLSDDPRSLQEALSRADAQQWRAALDSELASLIKAGTYSLVPRPSTRTPIGNKAVMKVKRGPDGKIIKYKVRIVAKGYAQKPGIDYDETYAPVVRYSSLRMVIALAAHYDLELHHMDVKSAYLNGDLEEEIYMELPEGAPREKGKENWVWRLHKSLYGLKQAGRTWHTKIDETFQRRGLIPLVSDQCVYIRRTTTSLVIIALYVDDLVLAASNLDELKKLKVDLTTEFDMEDLGEATFVLGIEITRHRPARTITITQSAYIKSILEKHPTGDNHKQTIPMETSARHTKATSDYQASAQEVKSYQSAIGSIMFAMLCTRPDIAYSVATLSKFAQNPTPDHHQAVQRVLRYLRGTNHLGITYIGTTPRSNEPELTGYCDSDWAADRDDRISVTGYAFLLCGGAISWQSKKQKTPALSTVEAEYMAAAAAAKEALWWRTQLQGLGYDTTSSTVLYSDSKGSIALAKNPEHHANTKHIDLRYHFIRHHVAERSIHLEYINTTAMAADILTKALSRDKHRAAAALLGMEAV